MSENASLLPWKIRNQDVSIYIICVNEFNFNAILYVNFSIISDELYLGFNMLIVPVYNDHHELERHPFFMIGFFITYII